MDISVSHQVFIFFAMVICGVACGIVFDLFRGIRYRRKTSSGVVAVQDILFWLSEVVLVYLVAYALNYAGVRAFELVALVIGSSVYFMTVSPYVISAVSRICTVAARLASYLAAPVRKAVFFVKKSQLRIKLQKKLKNIFTTHPR